MLNVQAIKHGLPAVIDISTGRESRSAASQRRLILYGSPAMKIVLTQSSSRNSIVTLAATRPRPRGRAGSWGSWLWVDIVSTPPPPPPPPLPPALAGRSEIGGRVLQQPLFFQAAGAASYPDRSRLLFFPFRFLMGEPSLVNTREAAAAGLQAHLLAARGWIT